jgi:prefoldin subunit 5
MLGDEAKRKVAKLTEEVAGADTRLKKIVAFIQSETSGLGEQIKDAQSMLDRSDDRIEVLSRDLAALGDTVRKQSEEIKTTQSVERAPTVEVETEPHIPTPPVNVVVEHPFENKPAQTEDGTTVIQLPEKIVYEQPIVTVVRRRNLEVVENAPVRPKPLPRLGTSQGKREAENIRNDLRRFEDLIPRLKEVEQTLPGLRTSIDQVAKMVASLTEVKADKSELQTLFEQFRMALGELNGRVGSIRKAVVAKADMNDLHEIQQEFARHLASLGATAGATEQFKCLLCGRPRTNVVGAIEDPDVAQRIGPPVSTRVTSLDPHGNSGFVYGDRGELYWGRSPDGRPIYSKGVVEDDKQKRPNSSAG